MTPCLKSQNAKNYSLIKERLQSSKKQHLTIRKVCFRKKSSQIYFFILFNSIFFFYGSIFFMALYQQLHLALYCPVIIIKSTATKNKKTVL